jgi:septal ring factor EnvC (AmiA/AmiB activator)
MRSKNEKKYAHYYILLEEAITYFNKYQVELNKKYVVKYKEKMHIQKEKIKEQTDKIDKLHSDIQELLKINKRLEKQNKKTEMQLNETLEKLDITNYKLDETKDELEDTSEKLYVVAKKINITTDDRVVKTKKSSILEYFVIMKNPNTKYKYYIIRGQKRYINKKKEELVDFTEIKSLECVPNANILWNLLKEKLKGNDFMGIRLNLSNMNEQSFLQLVDKVYNERKNINI